eukprot:gene6456-10462_t
MEQKNDSFLGAGVCKYSSAGYNSNICECKIVLSEALLKFRPKEDTKNTLLHEMIHAYLFMTKNMRDSSDHGEIFQSWMNKINKEEGTKITIYHTFHDEVDYYRVHWWSCDKCSLIIKRAMNRAPSKHDRWWAEHEAKCNGSFVKIKEPEKKTKTKSKSKNQPSISKFFEKKIVCSKCDEKILSSENHVCKEIKSKDSQVIEINESYEIIHGVKKDENQRVQGFLDAIQSVPNGNLFPKRNCVEPISKKKKLESSNFIDIASENQVFTPFKYAKKKTEIPSSSYSFNSPDKISDYYISPSPSNKPKTSRNLHFSQPKILAFPSSNGSENLDDSKEILSKGSSQTPESQKEFIIKKINKESEQHQVIDLTDDEPRAFRICPTCDKGIESTVKEFSDHLKKCQKTKKLICGCCEQAFPSNTPQEVFDAHCNECLIDLEE